MKNTEAKLISAIEMAVALARIEYTEAQRVLGVTMTPSQETSRIARLAFAKLEEARALI